MYSWLYTRRATDKKKLIEALQEALACVDSTHCGDRELTTMLLHAENLPEMSDPGSSEIPVAGMLAAILYSCGLQIQRLLLRKIIATGATAPSGPHAAYDTIATICSELYLCRPPGE